MHEAGARPRPRIAWLVSLALACGVTPVFAAEGLATRDPGVLALLEGLGANQSVMLPDARVLGPFNDIARRYGLHRHGPMSRNFSLKMVWAPERQTALFCGANHGAPHRLNDVWEFDLAANAWILLYAPDNPRSYRGLGKDPSDVRFVDGRLITVRGGPARVGHTWWGLAYDPRRQAMLFMSAWPTNMKAAVELVGGDPAELYRGPPLWAFYPAEGRWQPVSSPEPWPRIPFGGMLEYVPSLDGAVWHSNNWKGKGTWLLRSEHFTWQQLVPGRTFGPQVPAVEQIAYHDPKRDLLVVQRGSATYQFDVANRQWQLAVDGNPERKPAEALNSSLPVGYDFSAVMHYAPVGDVGLLFEFRDDRLWAYDAEARNWTLLQPKGPAPPSGKKRLAYHDPARNVFVVIQGTSVWAYRYALP